MERLTIKNSDGTYSQSSDCTFEKMFNKLVEFEDFMEGNKFESIENLQNAINGKFEDIFDETHKIWIKIVEDKNYAEKRNRILKDRWEKLKEFINENLQYDKEEFSAEWNSPHRFYAFIENIILAEMRDLEN